MQHDEPNAEKAVLVGGVGDEDAEDGGGGAGEVAAGELLRSIPGVVSAVLLCLSVVDISRRK